MRRPSERLIAIQLYPDNPNVELLDFLRGAGASPDPVLCYVHGSERRTDA